MKGCPWETWDIPIHSLYYMFKVKNVIVNFQFLLATLPAS